METLLRNAESARSEHEHRLQELNAALEDELSGDSGTGPAADHAREVELLVERALLLSYLGRDDEARSDHLRVLGLDDNHRVNLLALGRLLVHAGQKKAARIVYEKALAQNPDDLMGLISLGSIALQLDDLEAARTHYEAALALKPNMPEAHGGMYYTLVKMGLAHEAEGHAQMAFGQRNLFISPYRGDGPSIPVVLLVSSTGGNTPIEKLLDLSVFQTYVVVADFFNPAVPLPEHQFVFNGIGDTEVATNALHAAEKLIQGTTAPVLNLPAAVLATSRCENARRMAELPGVVTAKTALFPYGLLAGPEGVDALAGDGFSFPLLLRVPGFHMGEHFIDVPSASELAGCVAGLPGAGRPDASLIAIEYLDARGSDGCVRKYRAIFVDGEIYPLHLAISPNWKIHYFSADMADRPDHREEEERFLTGMPEFVGAKAMAGLQAIERMLGLEYGGVDFGISAEGDVLLFEANATMVVEQPSDDARWDYRRTAVDRIHKAVRAMLMRRASREFAAA